MQAQYKYIYFLLNAWYRDNVYYDKNINLVFNFYYFFIARIFM